MRQCVIKVLKWTCCWVGFICLDWNTQGGSIVGSFTPITQDDLAAIGRNYGLSNMRTEDVASGIYKTTVLIHADEGSVVLSIFEDTEDDATRAKEFLDYLESYGFDSLRRLRRVNNAPDLVIAGKQTMITQFIDGMNFGHKFEPQEGEDFEAITILPPDEMIVGIGEALAKLHEIPPPEYFEENTRVIPDNWNDNSRMIDKNLRMLIREVKGNILEWKNLPDVLIHGDPFPDNFIPEGLIDKLILIDWDTATKGPAILDMAMAIIGGCRVENKLDAKLVKLFLDGYESVRKLSDEEKLFLPAAIKYANALLAYKRVVNPSSKNPDSYKELLEFADRIPDSFDKLILPEIDLSL